MGCYIKVKYLLAILIIGTAIYFAHTSFRCIESEKIPFKNTNEDSTIIHSHGNFIKSWLQTDFTASARVTLGNLDCRIQSEFGICTSNAHVQISIPDSNLNFMDGNTFVSRVLIISELDAAPDATSEDLKMKSSCVFSGSKESFDAHVDDHKVMTPQQEEIKAAEADEKTSIQQHDEMFKQLQQQQQQQAALLQQHAARAGAMSTAGQVVAQQQQQQLQDELQQEQEEEKDDKSTKQQEQQIEQQEQQQQATAGTLATGGDQQQQDKLQQEQEEEADDNKSAIQQQSKQYAALQQQQQQATTGTPATSESWYSALSCLTPQPEGWRCLSDSPEPVSWEEQQRLYHMMADTFCNLLSQLMEQLFYKICVLVMLAFFLLLIMFQAASVVFLLGIAAKNKIPESWPKKAADQRRNSSNVPIHQAQSAGAVRTSNGSVPKTKLERTQSEGAARANSDNGQRSARQ